MCSAASIACVESIEQVVRLTLTVASKLPLGEGRQRNACLGGSPEPNEHQGTVVARLGRKASARVDREVAIPRAKRSGRVALRQVGVVRDRVQLFLRVAADARCGLRAGSGVSGG